MLTILVGQARITFELPDELIDERLTAFEKKDDCLAEEIRGTIHVRLAGADAFARTSEEIPERYVTDFAETLLFSDRIICFFRENIGWTGLSVGKGEVLCVPSGSMKPGKEQAATLFDYMKGGIFLLLGKLGYFVLHSSSVIMNNKVIAFSAGSGTGKTTHTQFWEQMYHAPVFNGDMLMIDACEKCPQAIGVPWSGSTGLTTQGKLPIAGVFFLERGQSNEVRSVNELEKLLLLTQRMLSVNYNQKAFMKNAEALTAAAREINCARLICLPEREAAEAAYEYAVNNWM